MIIDTHLHVWDLDRSPYAWIDRDVPPFNRSYAFDEVAPQLAENGVDAVILVQADDDDRDTDHMLEVAAERPEVIGVVAYVPLHEPARAAVRLEELLQNPYVVGIRNLTHDRADPDWVLRPDVDETLGLIEQAGLPWDHVAVLPRHLEHVATISERHPELRIVIDHLAKPPIGEASREPWWSLIEVAAQNPLVHAKISGLYPGADPASWTVEGLRPFVDRALAVFGPSRLMYGGDWPVSIPAGGYSITLNGLRSVLSEVSRSSAEAVWINTALRIYGAPLAKERRHLSDDGEIGPLPDGVGLVPNWRELLDEEVQRQLGSPPDVYELRSVRDRSQSVIPPPPEQAEPWDCTRIRQKAEDLVQQLEGIDLDRDEFDPYLGETSEAMQALRQISPILRVLEAERYLALAETGTQNALASAQSCLRAIEGEVGRKQRELQADLSVDRDHLKARLAGSVQYLEEHAETNPEGRPDPVRQYHAVTVANLTALLAGLEDIEYLSEFELVAATLNKRLREDICAGLATRQRFRVSRRRRRRALRRWILLAYAFAFLLSGVGIDLAIGATPVGGAVASVLVAVVLWVIDRNVVGPKLEHRRRAAQRQILIEDVRACGGILVDLRHLESELRRYGSRWGVILGPLVGSDLMAHSVGESPRITHN